MSTSVSAYAVRLCADQQLPASGLAIALTNDAILPRSNAPAGALSARRAARSAQVSVPSGVCRIVWEPCVFDRDAVPGAMLGGPPYQRGMCLGRWYILLVAYTACLTVFTACPSPNAFAAAMYGICCVPLLTYDCLRPC